MADPRAALRHLANILRDHAETYPSAYQAREWFANAATSIEAVLASWPPEPDKQEFRMIERTRPKRLRKP